MDGAMARERRMWTAGRAANIHAVSAALAGFRGRRAACGEAVDGRGRGGGGGRPRDEYALLTIAVTGLHAMHVCSST